MQWEFAFFCFGRKRSVLQAIFAQCLYYFNHSWHCCISTWMCRRCFCTRTDILFKNCLARRWSGMHLLKGDMRATIDKNGVTVMPTRAIPDVLWILNTIDCFEFEGVGARVCFYFTTCVKVNAFFCRAFSTISTCFCTSFYSYSTYIVPFFWLN